MLRADVLQLGGGAMKSLVVIAACLMVSAGLLAQDAITTLPDNYKVEFEN